MSYQDYNAKKAGIPSDSEQRKAKWVPYLGEIARQLKSEYAANRAGFKFA